MTKFVVGTSFLTREGCLVTIVDYKSCSQVVIEHQDYKVHRMEVFSNQFMTGGIKNRYKPSVHGVGFLGIGEKSTRKDGKPTRAYEVWGGMLSRCYSEVEHKRHPTYKDCTVADEWHNYQNFAEWYEGSDYGSMGYDVDKDILVTGNRVYSPETCCLIPPEINTAFVLPSKKSDCMTGVRFRYGKYVAEIKSKGKKIHLGTFSSEIEAYRCYKEAKELAIKSLAAEYKDVIGGDVYDALMSWTLKDNDSMPE